LPENPGIEQGRSNTHKQMTAAETAGSMAECGEVELTLHKCQLISFCGRKSVEEGIPWLHCVGLLNAIMQIKVDPDC